MKKAFLRRSSVTDRTDHPLKQDDETEIEYQEEPQLGAGFTFRRIAANKITQTSRVLSLHYEPGSIRIETRNSVYHLSHQQ